MNDPVSANVGWVGGAVTNMEFHYDVCILLDLYTLAVQCTLPTILLTIQILTLYDTFDNIPEKQISGQ